MSPRTDSDKTNACKGTMATEITEPGAPAVKSSYFTFFANGEPHNYNLLQKMGSWKHDKLIGYISGPLAIQCIFFHPLKDFFMNITIHITRVD